MSWRTIQQLRTEARAPRASRRHSKLLWESQIHSKIERSEAELPLLHTRPHPTMVLLGVQGVRWVHAPRAQQGALQTRPLQKDPVCGGSVAVLVAEPLKLGVGGVVDGEDACVGGRPNPALGPALLL